MAAHTTPADTLLDLESLDDLSRVPTPSSPSSLSGGESLSGLESANEAVTHQGHSSAIDASIHHHHHASSQHRGQAGPSSAGSGLASRRQRHHHHGMALGTGSAKLGFSITDSAQSTEDEMYEKDGEADDREEEEEDDSRGGSQIHYPALATPTASNVHPWPFGVASSSHSPGVPGAGPSALTAISEGLQGGHKGKGAVYGDGMISSPPSATPLSSPLQDEDIYAMNTTQLVHGTRSTSLAAFLPHEILLKILKNVRGTQDLINALLVCKSWCQCGVELLWNKPLFPHVGPLIKMLVVLSRPVSTFPYASFIKRLNFSQLTQKMSDTLLVRLTVCERLERLTLAGCSEVSDDALGILLQKCKNLVALDLSECVRITDATVAVAAQHCRRLQGLNLSGCRLVTDAGVEAIAKGCPMLRRVKLRNLENLTDDAVISLGLLCPLLLEVDLYSCTSITDRTLWTLFRNSSHLRELSLNNCTQVTGDGFPLRDGNLLYIKGSDDSALQGKKYLNSMFHSMTVKSKTEYPDHLPHLQNTTPLTARMFDHVRYLDLTGLLHLNDTAMEGIISTMPHIRNLVLAKCVNLTDETVFSICKLGKHIHFLHLGHVSSLTDKAVTALARSCTRLRYIDLACCPQLTDLSVFELAQNLPRLKRIGLVRVANLTDQAIFALAERTTLERIHLSYCEHVSVSAIHFLLVRLHRLNHLSLTGVPAFRREDLQHFCRPPPKDFNSHQRSTFCVYSGKGVHELRKHLIALQQQANLGHMVGVTGGRVNQGFPHHNATVYGGLNGQLGYPAAAAGPSHSHYPQHNPASQQAAHIQGEDEADMEDEAEDDEDDEGGEEDADESRGSRHSSHSHHHHHRYNSHHRQARQHRQLQAQPASPSAPSAGPSHSRPAHRRMDINQRGSPSGAPSSQGNWIPSPISMLPQTVASTSSTVGVGSTSTYIPPRRTSHHHHSNSLGTPFRPTGPSTSSRMPGTSPSTPSTGFGVGSRLDSMGVRDAATHGSSYLDTLPSPTGQQHGSPRTPGQSTSALTANANHYLNLNGLQQIVHPDTVRDAEDEAEYEARHALGQQQTQERDVDGDRRMRSVSVEVEDTTASSNIFGRVRGDTISQRDYAMER